MNKATQRQALTAGARSALQAFEGTLALILGAGLLGGVTNAKSIPFVALGYALLAGLVVAFFTGLRAYIDFVVNGIPATYAAAPATLGTTADGVAVVTTLPAAPVAATSSPAPDAVPAPDPNAQAVPSV